MKYQALGWVLVITLAAGLLWAQEGKKSDQPSPPDQAAAPAAPQGPHEFTLTPEDTARKNPVKFTDVSAGRGKKIYDTQCAMCHGQKGDGKGDMVEEMKIHPPDFTNPETLKKRTDGDIFAIITQGSEAMPSQGKRMSDTHKWNIVNYLRALSGKTPEKAKGNEPEEGVILIPQ